MGNVSSQLTLRQSLPPDKLVPGVYEVTIRVNDLKAQRADEPALPP